MGQAAEAAQEAMSYDRGVVHAVNVADDAWDGAVYAKKVNEQLLKASKELDKLGPPRGIVTTTIKRLANQIDLATSNPDDQGEKNMLGRMFWRFNQFLKEAGKVIEPVQNNGTEPLIKFLEDKDHPSLFPPPDGPGMEN